MKNNWISVKDKTPFTNEDLIKGEFRQEHIIVTDGIMVGTSSYEGAIYPTENGDSSWTAWNSYGDIEPYKITHWMPFPDLPEKS